MRRMCRRLTSIPAPCWEWHTCPFSSPVNRFVFRMDIIVSYLLDRLAGTKIVLLGLLPRARGSHEQPSVFTAATDKVNDGYK